jgi:hypothetical protein
MLKEEYGIQFFSVSKKLGITQQDSPKIFIMKNQIRGAAYNYYLNLGDS